MQPIPGRNASLGYMFSLQDFLPHLGHADGVENIVIRRIAIGDVFQGHAADKPNYVWKLGLQHTVRAQVIFSQIIDKRVYDEFNWVEHVRPPYPYAASILASRCLCESD